MIPDLFAVVFLLGFAAGVGGGYHLGRQHGAEAERRRLTAWHSSRARSRP